jgi:hypothetical protein
MKLLVAVVMAFSAQQASSLTAACHMTSTLSWLGDGICDLTLVADTTNIAKFTHNTKACGWDGGDCCNGRWCRDPNYGAVDYPGCNITSGGSSLGDRTCDDIYNTVECGWDLGDCCPGVRCFDPEADNPYPDCTVLQPKIIGDDTCEVGQSRAVGQGDYNVLACGWDGGDCCPGDDCLDPTATDPYPSCVVEHTSWVGDAWCDYVAENGYNTPMCGWDGGDCCPSQHCLDPEHNTTVVPDDVCDTNGQYQWLNDGYCDQGFAEMNTRACDWDRGDCCPGINCLDPDVPNPYPNCLQYEYPNRIGDGICDDDDPGFFNEACGWDGGDCFTTEAPPPPTTTITTTTTTAAAATTTRKGRKTTTTPTTTKDAATGPGGVDNSVDEQPTASAGSAVTVFATCLAVCLAAVVASSVAC